jgi:hypothetical protein
MDFILIILFIKELFDWPFISRLVISIKFYINEHYFYRLWKCTIGKRGRLLHAIAGNRTASIGEEFNFVPWVVLDGLRDNDAFYALEENLCKRLNEPKPHPCSKFS